MNNKVYMGTLNQTWNANKKIKTITFNVTDDCNLACTYCYFTHKNNKNKMTFDIAKKAVDYILNNEKFLMYDGVVWDFIGGEPTLEIDLIIKTCEYILVQMYVKKHKWFSCYRFMIGTNGLLYSDRRFQRFLEMFFLNLNVNITIDGSKEKHDLSRKKKDGTGSYDDVAKIIPIWQKQTGSYITKATFSHADLPYLKDSIINLWNLGLKMIMANVVFEDVWEKDDDLIFEKQLKELADYILENHLWNKYSVRFFSPYLGYPSDESSMNTNFCGSGNMLTIDPNGNFYPCNRFLDSALNHCKGRIIGNIYKGIDTDKIRAFNVLDARIQSSEECLNCQMSNECSWCSALNYDDNKTIFKRTTYHCKMHKANVRACKYFWKKYEDLTGEMSPRRYNEYTNTSANHKYLYFLCDPHIDFCKYTSKTNRIKEKMSDSTIKKGLDYCENNGYTPVFIGKKTKDEFGYYINPYYYEQSKDEFNVDIIDYQKNSVKPVGTLADNVIIRFNKSHLNILSFCIKELIKNNLNINNINMCLCNIEELSVTDIKKYYYELKRISDYIFELWSLNRYININVITGILFKEKFSACGAGNTTFVLAPNEKIYPCYAMYNQNTEIIGDLNSETIIGSSNFVIENSPICKNCDCYACSNCIVYNKKTTGEYLAPSEVQCAISKLEKRISYRFQNKVKNNLNLPFEINSCILDDRIVDPLLNKKRENSFLCKGLATILEKELGEQVDEKRIEGNI